MKIILPLIFILISFGCDINAGKRPYDYPPAKWVSEEPKMWFEIGESDNNPYALLEEINGYLVLDGQNIEIEVFFDYGVGVFFSEKGYYEPFTMGICKFFPDKLVVQIYKERDNFLNGLCDTITFIRVPEWVFDVVYRHSNSLTVTPE